MKKILTTASFFAFLGLLVFSFATCKHFLGSSDVKQRQPLGYQDVVDLLSSGNSSNPVKYRQSNWGIYDESGNLVSNDGWGAVQFLL